MSTNWGVVVLVLFIPGSHLMEEFNKVFLVLRLRLVGEWRGTIGFAQWAAYC